VAGDSYRPERYPIRAGLCSVTLRALDVADVAGVAAAAGLEAIEWGGDVHVPPGDARAARRAREVTKTAGLRVAAYGSYFRGAGFGPVLESAIALGAPRIRVWAGSQGSAAASPADREAVAGALRAAALAAAGAGICVALEYHGGTLTDTADSALALLAAVGEGVGTYWQPPQGLPDDAALAELDRLAPHVVAVHAFAWWPRDERLRLAERGALWRRAFARLAREGRALDALLEFVPGDDPALVAPEAATLRELARA
jgi:3-dehydroshikimate dehydratase